jgi:hypothetical protein
MIAARTGPKTVEFDHNGICSSLNNNAFQSTIYLLTHAHGVYMMMLLMHHVAHRAQNPIFVMRFMRRIK